MTTEQAILKVLKDSPTPLAIHEMKIMGASDTAKSARLREMRRAGKVAGWTRPGKKFKEWVAVTPPNGSELGKVESV